MAGGRAGPGDDLTGRLADVAVVGIDTSIFIYHLEANQRYLPLTRLLLSAVQSGQVQGVTSTVTLMEITVRPWQLGQGAVARQYETLLINFPNLRIVDVSRTVAPRAAQLRAHYRVRPADALQVAAVLVHRADLFITNDQTLERVQPEIEILYLERLLSPLQ